MEEEKREEEVEELKDDFEEIKEMQKTQELKKIQEEKIVEEKKVEEKEKKCHPLFVSILVILLLGVFACMGFFGGIYFYKNSVNKETVEDTSKDRKNDKEIENEKKDDNSKQLEEKIVELTEEELKKEIESFDFVDQFFNAYYSVKYPFDVKDLSNQEILETGLFKLSPKDSNGYTKFPSEFSKNEMDNAIIQVFGSDMKYTDENIKCFLNDGPLYEFRESLYAFYGAHGHGGRQSYRSKSYFVKAYNNESKGYLDIEEKVLYAGTCGDVCGPVYNFYKEAKVDAKGLYSENVQRDITDADYDKGYSEFKDQLPITKFHFEKDSKGHYGLKSISVE